MTQEQIRAKLRDLHEKWGFCDRERHAKRQSGLEKRIPKSVLKAKKELHEAAVVAAYEVWARIPETDRARLLRQVADVQQKLKLALDD